VSLPTATITALKSQWGEARQRALKPLDDPALPPRGVGAVQRDLARATDETIRRLWQACGLGPTWSLLAVGGYGRGQLAPHSDIDVLVLRGQPGADPQALETFVQACWDVGLAIGSAVRDHNQTLQSAAEDVTTMTALLEARTLIDPTEQWPKLLAALRQQLDPVSFFQAKVRELNQRHQRFDDTAYALEPNCKEAPGGLRDLHTIRWLANACGWGDSWETMQRNGLITSLERQRLANHEATLNLIRARLHVLTNRREDRLIFDVQTALAHRFGMQDRYATDGKRLIRRASELLMKRYYWAAKGIRQLTDILLPAIEQGLHPDWPSTGQRLDPDFVVRGGLLDIDDEQLFERQPAAILQAFVHFQQHRAVEGMAPRTLRALYHARAVMTPQFGQQPAHRALFMQLLQAPQGQTHVFRLLNRTSVLGRYLRPFRRIVGQMQHDLFHIYTVDQHILMVLRNVRRFFIADHAHEYPLCSQLAADWDKPWLLYVAALFHDIAKGRGGDHSVLGAREVHRFAKAHGMANDDRDLVAFLVAHHLHMSHVAQKQDLSDPEVIQAFAQRMGNARRLTALYLLTVADIRGTSPKVWNAWKGQLLQDLFTRTLRVLGGEHISQDTIVRSHQRDALQIMARQALPHDAHQRLWQQLDVRYFLRHDADEIAWHTRHASRALALNQVGHGVAKARRSHRSDGLQVMVFCPDQPDLFARLCGQLSGADLEVLDANIYTTHDGYALDTFEVTATHMAEQPREWMAMLEAKLSAALTTQAELAPPSTGRVSRRVRHFPTPTRISCRPDENGKHFLITVASADRSGLLYTLAYTFASFGLEVLLARISTLGERIEDIFLVRGAALADARQRNVFEAALQTAIDGERASQAMARP
jgi:[protein-PII] uridylyltransferase